MSTIGERIKWLRKDRCHLTQEVVGNYIGVGKATINKYENGIITNIPSDKILLLSEILETTPEFIMGWDENPEKFVHSQYNIRMPSNDSDKEDATLNAEIFNTFSRLSSSGKKQAIDYIQFLLSREEKK